MYFKPFKLSWTGFLLVNVLSVVHTMAWSSYMRSIHWSRSTSSVHCFFFLLSFWCCFITEKITTTKRWQEKKTVHKMGSNSVDFFLYLSHLIRSNNKNTMQRTTMLLRKKKQLQQLYSCAIIMLLANTIITPHSFVMHSKKKIWCWCVHFSCTIFRVMLWVL